MYCRRGREETTRKRGQPPMRMQKERKRERKRERKKKKETK
jgi:hypothetical protein